MQKETGTKKAGKIITLPAVDLHEEFPKSIDLKKEPEPDPIKQGYPLVMPDCAIINGTGFIIVQMHRRGSYMTSGGVYVPGGDITNMNKTAREISPIPSDALFFVVGYDPDINLKYRVEKMKLLRLNDENRNQQEQIKLYEYQGILDQLRLGDEVIINHENFVPVKLKIDFKFDYYRVHTMDILAIRKNFPRLSIEQPNLVTETEKKMFPNQN